MSIIDSKLAINIIKLIWICIAILSLVITLSIFDGHKNSDTEDLLIYSMLFLSFPTGILASWLAFIILYFFASISVIDETLFDVNYIYLTIEWFFLFIVGYIQWFFLIPIIYKKHIGNKYPHE